MHDNRLFASQGFEGTTTLQIAGEGGVTEPLLYYHFKGKDELFTHFLPPTMQHSAFFVGIQPFDPK